MIETYEFNTAEEFFTFLSPWGEGSQLDGYIFRGHSQEHYSLLPSALRLESSDYFWKVCGLGRPIDEQWKLQTWQIRAEYNLLRSFYRLADQRGLEVPLARRVRNNLAQDFDIFGGLGPFETDSWIPDDLLETAALAQHYGVPTRLLDWTYDIFVSLFFAFKGAGKEDGRVVVWALNKEYLSFLNQTQNGIDIKFITPHYASNPNLNAQKGLFTHCPIKRVSMIDEAKLFMNGNLDTVNRCSLDDFIFEQREKVGQNVNIFKKFIVPCHEAPNGRKILNRLGYDSARIYPGYQGVAEQLLGQHEYL